MHTPQDIRMILYSFTTKGRDWRNVVKIASTDATGDTPQSTPDEDKWLYMNGASQEFGPVTYLPTYLPIFA